MTWWHGYPQAPGAHPERPWWARGTRSDGWAIRWGLPGNRGWFAQDPEGRGHDLPGTFEEVMATIDREHPLPCPPPLCGQVWVWPSDTEAMVVAVQEGRPLYSAAVRWASYEQSTAWPPPGAVLVAGPGARWAPPG